MSRYISVVTVISQKRPIMHRNINPQHTLIPRLSRISSMPRVLGSSNPDVVTIRFSRGIRCFLISKLNITQVSAFPPQILVSVPEAVRSASCRVTAAVLTGGSYSSLAAALVALAGLRCKTSLTHSVCCLLCVADHVFSDQDLPVSENLEYHALMQ
jgi:hypothetical protein